MAEERLEAAAADEYTQDRTVDLHGNPVLRSKRGGWKACGFVVVQVRKKMKSATIGLCAVSTVVAMAASFTASDSDPLIPCYALALCMAFNGGITLIVRGVHRR